MQPHAITGVKAYVGVYAALMIATVVTVGVSALHLTLLVGIGVALAIAATKATLVAAYFMHLKWESRLLYGGLGLTLFLLMTLMGLVVASAADQVGTIL